MTDFEKRIDQARQWMKNPRFKEITRLYAARQVVEQQGSIGQDYTIAREAAEAFYARLRELFENKKSITTFGPYSPGQAVAMKRLGIEGIYLGGWATSAKGSIEEDPGPDLASYPLSQVPNEAAGLVRALLTADRNQMYARSRMTAERQSATPAVDYRPFIIADADTGHGGDAHVRNLIRRFVEVGVPGYHIEDQRPGAKKCGHQGGKVLVTSDEQIKRLNTARFQLDVMGVPGIIVARTDAESATLLDANTDERDHPFILGATNTSTPSYKLVYLSLLRKLHELGIEDVNGHLLYQVSEDEYKQGFAWLQQAGLESVVKETVDAFKKNPMQSLDTLVDKASSKLVDAWQTQANLKTYPEAVADAIESRTKDGEEFEMTADQWRAFAQTVSLSTAQSRAASLLGVKIDWDCERARTPDGFFQVRGGIEYAIAKSLAAAPFADLLWMETKTADLHDAKMFADAIHAKFPTKMLAYNLSPSFNWDSTGMTDEQMRAFPEELGKMGFVFNFITYGGHQIDGLAAEEFAQSLRTEGMLALARLQRKFRLTESPYTTPQTLVGGPRLDAALAACSGWMATTKAMGKGSTQFQHLIQTEVPTSLLQEWINAWREHYGIKSPLKVELRPHRAGSDLLELKLLGDKQNKMANVIFSMIQDRRGRNILSVRDQNTFETELRQKRLMTLLHLFLIHRYKVFAVHYLTPTEDNQVQAEKMKKHDFYSNVNNEVGDIIVADVNPEGIAKYLAGDRAALSKFIRKAS